MFIVQHPPRFWSPPADPKFSSHPPPPNGKFPKITSPPLQPGGDTMVLVRIFLPFGQKIFNWHFGPRVYPRGSYVIIHVRPWSVVSPSLNISETALRIFLFFFMKLVHHKGTKVRARFLKKIVGGSQMGETPLFGVFLTFFVHI